MKTQAQIKVCKMSSKPSEGIGKKTEEDSVFFLWTNALMTDTHVVIPRLTGLGEEGAYSICRSHRWKDSRNSLDLVQSTMNF
jgi:hypothetical protein